MKNKIILFYLIYGKHCKSNLVLVFLQLTNVVGNATEKRIDKNSLLKIICLGL